LDSVATGRYEKLDISVTDVDHSEIELNNVVVEKLGDSSNLKALVLKSVNDVYLHHLKSLTTRQENSFGPVFGKFFSQVQNPERPIPKKTQKNYCCQIM
jgi:hypothetical protein